MWRAAELGVHKEEREVFPWILWYLWKGRNNKLFNGEDTPPLEILRLAISEARSWKVAQIVPTMDEEANTEAQERDGGSRRCREEGVFGEVRCQVDASWTHESGLIGLGFIAMEGGSRCLLGIRNSGKAPSPLHAEAEGLIWAMREMIKMGKRAVHFETDCAQLVNVVKQSEEWPAMAALVEEIILESLHFEFFSLVYIPRGMNQ